MFKEKHRKSMRWRTLNVHFVLKGNTWRVVSYPCPLPWFRAWCSQENVSPGNVYAGAARSTRCPEGAPSITRSSWWRLLLGNEQQSQSCHQQCAQAEVKSWLSPLPCPKHTPLPHHNPTIFQLWMAQTACLIAHSINSPRGLAPGSSLGRRQRNPVQQWILVQGQEKRIRQREIESTRQKGDQKSKQGSMVSNSYKLRRMSVTFASIAKLGK